MRTPMLVGTSKGEQIFYGALQKKEILTFASFSNYAGLFITCPWWPNVYTIYNIYILTFACETPFVLAPNQPEYGINSVDHRHLLWAYGTHTIVLEKTCRPRIHAGCQFPVFRSRTRMDPYCFGSPGTGSAMTIGTGLDPVDMMMILSLFYTYPDPKLFTNVLNLRKHVSELLEPITPNTV